MLAVILQRRIGVAMGLMLLVAAPAVVLLAPPASADRGGPAATACPGDTDGSGAVDVNDLLNVILNWGAGPFEPPGSDTDGDGVVNVDDLVTVIVSWGPCPATPYLDGYSNSGCLSVADGGELGCQEDDAFEIVADVGELSIVHLNATYNCCPEDIEVTLEAEGLRLILTEAEILDIPCPCICCYSVTSTVGGLAPGEYVVEYRWYDYDSGEERCHMEDVAIPARR